MNGKQMRQKVSARAFNHRQMNRTILAMEKSFGTVKKTLNPEQQKKK
ncbi:MAG: hypothetical protein K2G89_09235 [Lachnospiraceae bacterium]|nr:hypothetical protein [Lachnospiraceae bacterium]